MKTITTKHTPLISIGFLLIVNTFFASTPDSLSCLELSGKVLKLKANEGAYTVSLIKENEVVESQKVKGNSLFKFLLQKNNFYTIQILKEGYAPRLVSIDTKLADEFKDLYQFHFDTELINDEEALNLNPEALDLPIARISFDTTKRWFKHDAAYTSSVKQKLYSGHVQLNRSLLFNYLFNKYLFIIFVMQG